MTSEDLKWPPMTSNFLQWPPMTSNNLQWPPRTSMTSTSITKALNHKVWQDVPRFGSILVAGGILATLVISVCCVCCCLQYKRTKKEKEKRRRESEQEEEERGKSSQVEVWPRFWSFWQKLLTAVDYWNVCQEYTNIFVPSFLDIVKTSY